MNLTKHGRRIDLSYSFGGARIHRSWVDKEMMHRDLEALFWLRDHGLEIADIVKVQARTGKLPRLEKPTSMHTSVTECSPPASKRFASSRREAMRN